MPAANSIEVQVKRLYSGRDSSGPRRYRPYRLRPMNTTTPTMPVARRKYHHPNQVVMKSTTPLITLSAVSGEASAHRARARTEPAAARKTRRFKELVGVVVVSTGFDVREDSESLMSFDVTVVGMKPDEVGHSADTAR